MISGSTPSVWISTAPRNSKRTVRYASGTAINEATTTLIVATKSELKNDSRISPVEKNAAKWPSVKLPSPSRNAVTNTVPTGTISRASRKAAIAASTSRARHEAPKRRSSDAAPADAPRPSPSTALIANRRSST